LNGDEIKTNKFVVFYQIWNLLCMLVVIDVSKT